MTTGQLDLKQAEKAGRMAARVGRLMSSNPYTPGSDVSPSWEVRPAIAKLRVAWNKGWRQEYRRRTKRRDI